MEDGVAALARRVAELAQRLETVEKRLEALETRKIASSNGPLSSLASAPVSAEVSSPALGQLSVLALLGRTVLIVAGAFLLRTLTESKTVPQEIGVALGLAYALGWIGMAARSGRRERVATFDGAIGLLLGFAILWETTTRFHILSPAAAATLWCGMTLMALIVAWRRDLPKLGWFSVAAGAAAAIAIAFPTRALVPFVLALLLVEVLLAAFPWRRPWPYLDWPLLPVLNTLSLLAGALVLTKRSGSAPATIVAMLVLLLIVSLAVTLQRSGKPDLFWIAQSGTILLIALPLIILLTHPGDPARVAAAVVLLAAGATLFVFALVQSRSPLSITFFSSAGLLLVLFSTALLMRGAALTVTWAAIFIAAYLAARRRGDSRILTVAFAAAVAPATAAGLLAVAGRAFFSPAPGSTSAVTVLAILVLILIATAALLAPRPTADSLAVAANTTLVAIAAFCAAGVLASVAIGAVGSSDAARVAATRTVILSIAAGALAALGSLTRFREATLLVKPLLIALALKLLAEDFRVGRAATLFAALAVYGAIMLLTARLSRVQESVG